MAAWSRPRDIAGDWIGFLHQAVPPLDRAISSDESVWHRKRALRAHIDERDVPLAPGRR
jgi:hypothetical protein